MQHPHFQDDKLQDKNFQQDDHTHSAPEKKRRAPILIWILILALIVIVGAVLLFSLLGTSKQTASGTRGVTPTAVKKNVSTPPVVEKPVKYPPKTLADFHALAARGDATAVHEFKSESVGLTGICPQQKREVTVDPKITGQRLAEDLLAYYYAQHLDNNCGSVVFAYHNRSEPGNGYTAGRVILDVADQNNVANTNPNEKNLKHTLILNVGDAASAQDYVVTY